MCHSLGHFLDTCRISVLICNIFCINTILCIPDRQPHINTFKTEYRSESQGLTSRNTCYQWSRCPAYNPADISSAFLMVRLFTLLLVRDAYKIDTVNAAGSLLQAWFCHYLPTCYACYFEFHMTLSPYEHIYHLVPFPSHPHIQSYLPHIYHCYLISALIIVIQYFIGIKYIFWEARWHSG